ncbi:DUF4247 domain-containing protein [Aneurinibacillus migulanus]|uniref:DUF4247 domain-containing protein n=1 Tax=Aneurinibacillus migulanus TaxID=47500 RepID=UPI00209D4A72|nr:DUF4247 domain-containing protein [Aneurinibacillus migulanus]MCP1356513.1 DUF4247 domain-containing protein [Aneurinibacillus migulanus]
MVKRLFTIIKTVLAVVLVASTLAGCTSQAMGSSYPLESVTQDGKQQSRVYRAENKTVPQVAEELSEQKKPKEISKEDNDQMFLVYSDEWYNLQKDPNKPEDTLIEVSNLEFVRQNYNPSFLEGYILASILDDLFDSHKRYGGSYRGYADKDIYKPKTKYHTPTAKERKNLPPITTEGTGSIIKRGDTSSSSSGNTRSSVGSSGSIIKKSDSDTSASKEKRGKIIRSSDEGSSYDKQRTKVKPKDSMFSRPKNNSPPKVKVGGSGKIFKRR